jgi:NADH-quinone oxidoreductase subunit N
VGEYFTLLLLATVGMMFLVSTEEMLMLFVSLELTSLSLYVLVAFNKRERHAAEAALKYFLFGSVAAAFMLFGLSLVYGLSGATTLGQIATQVQTQPLDPLLGVAVVMVIMGFGFKVAAVPFHLWAPDAYEGAPIPAAALIASGSKVASFFVFAKVVALGFAGVEGSGAWGQVRAGWLPVLAVLAVGSMLLGNLTAIVQRHLRRLLAYSAIAHAGYVLLGLMAMGHPAARGTAMAAVLYYVATYALTTVGAFGVVAVIERATGDGRIETLAGLSRRSPLPALCLLVFLLSLAGIPPLAGFFGKFYVFTAAVGAEPKDLGLLWLVILAIALSAVSLYYYLRVLKEAYVAPAAAAAPPILLPWTDRVLLAVAALGVLLLGALPGLLLDPLARAIQASGF